MQRTTFLSLGFMTLLLAPLACGDDKQASGSDTDATTGTTEATDTVGTTTGTTADTPTGTGTTGEPTTGTTDEPTTGDACVESMHDPGSVADGNPCTANGDCMSETCLKWFDNQTDAVCGPRTECSNTRFIGTVFDFDTGQPIAGANLRVVGAVTAIANPAGATGLVTAVSDADGRIDVTSAAPITEILGVVGLVDGGSYYVTATGLAAPYDGVSPTAYPPLNGIHDIWGVPSAKLAEWTGYLETDADPDVVMAMPLGDNGGVIGLVRQAGTPLAGAVVVSEDMGSKAKIRYLNEDGMGFGADATSSNGVFIIVGPGIGEDFTVEVGGMPTGLSGTAGSAKGAAFVLVFNVP